MRFRNTNLSVFIFRDVLISALIAITRYYNKRIMVILCMINLKALLNCIAHTLLVFVFLGEGKNTVEEHNEFKNMVIYARKKGLKTCLYCGRDTIIESWMKVFDYIKLGSYQVLFGGLSSASTNQRMFAKNNNEYIDITFKFWE